MGKNKLRSQFSKFATTMWRMKDRAIVVDKSQVVLVRMSTFFKGREETAGCLMAVNSAEESVKWKVEQQEGCEEGGATRSES